MKGERERTEEALRVISACAFATSKDEETLRRGNRRRLVLRRVRSMSDVGREEQAERTNSAASSSFALSRNIPPAVVTSDKELCTSLRSEKRAA
jgi:hypothetical protein